MFVELLMKIYIYQHPKLAVVLLILLFTSGVAPCDSSDEPRSCHIDNGARSLLVQAAVDQDDNITYNPGDDISSCFTINETNINVEVKVFIDDCINNQFNNWTYNYQNNAQITRLCVNIPDIGEDHKIEVQLVDTTDASVSCFQPIFIKGLPDAINLTKLEIMCDGVYASFKWPHGATSVNITVYDDYDAIQYSINIPFDNSTNFTGYNIPIVAFSLSKTNHISLLGVNTAGPGINITTSIFIPQEIINVEYHHLRYLNSGLTVDLYIKVNNSCPFIGTIYLATNCSISPKNELLPLALDKDNKNIIEIPVDEVYLQSNKRNCLFQIYNQNKMNVVYEIFGLYTTDIQHISYDVINNNRSLNFTCTFIENSPALGCLITINRVEHAVLRNNSHIVTAILPISEGFQNITVYEIEDNEYIYYMTLEIEIVHNTTGGNDTTCVCRETDDDTGDCDCGTPSPAPRPIHFWIIIGVAIVAMIGTGIIASFIARHYYSHNCHYKYAIDQIESGNIILNDGDSQDRVKTSPESQTSTTFTGACEESKLLHRYKEQETREGGSASSNCIPSESAPPTSSTNTVAKQSLNIGARYVLPTDKANAEKSGAPDDIVVIPNPHIPTPILPTNDDYLQEGHATSGGNTDELTEPGRVVTS